MLSFCWLWQDYIGWETHKPTCLLRHPAEQWAHTWSRLHGGVSPVGCYCLMALCPDDTMGQLPAKEEFHQREPHVKVSVILPKR